MGHWTNFKNYCKRTINSGLFDKQFRNFKTNKCEDLN